MLRRAAVFATHFILLLSAVCWRKCNIFFKDLLNLTYKNASTHFMRSVLLYQAGSHDHFTSTIFVVLHKRLFCTPNQFHIQQTGKTTELLITISVLLVQEIRISHTQTAFALWEQNRNLGNLEAGGTILSKTEWG